ncbi:hypothetical protein CPSG_07148 [Coccidioides posadasii str. Silveira]|uniref:Uncharacterized protein n=1 Tax=Coccidioides posadasii (strain RMSCC 757 / Silveira) TaxID=443226 RepID=E9DBE6_COCPS|nr:hypothetical protein CPSG_07148 [Coccidioides posadasii str. Silveira]
MALIAWLEAQPEISLSGSSTVAYSRELPTQPTIDLDRRFPGEFLTFSRAPNLSTRITRCSKSPGARIAYSLVSFPVRSAWGPRSNPLLNHYPSSVSHIISTAGNEIRLLCGDVEKS